MLLAFFAMLAAAHCPPVKLSAEGEAKTFITRFANNSDGFRKTSANFSKAYARACAEGLFKAKPLVSVKDKRLYLSNAPNANIASIYAGKRRMLLEYPFIADGKSNVPTADELHEAIYCAVHGASANEQEESGRCLPD